MQASVTVVQLTFLPLLNHEESWDLGEGVKAKLL